MSEEICSLCGYKCKSDYYIVLHKDRKPHPFCRECFNAMVDKPREEILKIIQSNRNA